MLRAMSMFVGGSALASAVGLSGPGRAYDS